MKREFSFIPTLKVFREKYFDLSALEFTVEMASMYKDKYIDKPVPVVVLAKCLALNIPVSVDETSYYEGTYHTSSRVKNYHPVLVTDMTVLRVNKEYEYDYPDMIAMNKRLDFKEVSKHIYKGIFKNKCDSFYVSPTLCNGYQEPVVFTFETFHNNEFNKGIFGKEFIADGYIEYEEQILEFKIYMREILLNLAKAIKAGEKSGKLNGYNGKEDAYFYVGERVQNVPEYLSGLYKGIE